MAQPPHDHRHRRRMYRPRPRQRRAQRLASIVADRSNVGPEVTRRGVVAALVMVAAPAALWWLQPWKFFIRTTIDEALPPAAQTIYLGEFTSHIHRTTGTARLVTLPDDRRILRIEKLHATQGPQLRVWLSDARVVNEGTGFRRFGRSRHIDLGPCAPTAVTPTTAYPARPIPRESTA
jgi:electron transfer DM13